MTLGGTGSTALLPGPRVKEIVGTDLSARMIEIARGKAAAEGAENVRFEAATVFDDALAPGSFDVVTAFHFLHRVDGIPRVVRGVHAPLRPGGRFTAKTVCLAALEGTPTDAGFEILETGSHPPRPPSRFPVARKA